MEVHTTKDDRFRASEVSADQTRQRWTRIDGEGRVEGLRVERQDELVSHNFKFHLRTALFFTSEPPPDNTMTVLTRNILSLAIAFGVILSSCMPAADAAFSNIGLLRNNNNNKNVPRSLSSAWQLQDQQQSQGGEYAALFSEDARALLREMMDATENINMLGSFSFSFSMKTSDAPSDAPSDVPSDVPSDSPSMAPTEVLTAPPSPSPPPVAPPSTTTASPSSSSTTDGGGDNGIRGGGGGSEEQGAAAAAGGLGKGLLAVLVVGSVVGVVGAALLVAAARRRNNDMSQASSVSSASLTSESADQLQQQPNGDGLEEVPLDA